MEKTDFTERHVPSNGRLLDVYRTSSPLRSYMDFILFILWKYSGKAFDLCEFSNEHLEAFSYIKQRKLGIQLNKHQFASTTENWCRKFYPIRIVRLLDRYFTDHGLVSVKKIKLSVNWTSAVYKKNICLGLRRDLYLHRHKHPYITHMLKLHCF